MRREPINVLELNNLDIYGKRFNGYSIQEYINSKNNLGFKSYMLVNHKLGTNKYVKPLFKHSALEKFDWKLDEIEKNLATKNQISISEEALFKNPYFKRADILHFHMYHNMHLPISFLTKIPINKKVILDLHDTFWLTDQKIPMLEAFSFSDLNKASLNKQRKLVLRSIDADFIIHSPYMERLFKKSDATKGLKLHNINFGINTNIFKSTKSPSELKKQYNIPENNLVLFFRAQREFKGLDYIIEALTKLQVKNPISLITVNETGVLKSLSKKYDVHEFGFVEEKKVVELFNICDIFLSPSTEESFGFMAVEAMACAKPVVVFDGTALPVTVNSPEIGVSVKRDSTALMQAIVNLIQNPEERKKRGEAGLNFVKRTYSEEKYFKDNLKIYRQLAKERSRKIIKVPYDTDNDKLMFRSIALGLSNKIMSNNIGSIKPYVINYNNLVNQKELSRFNKNLYYNIMRKKKLVERIKDSIPAILKKAIKRIVRHNEK